MIRPATIEDVPAIVSMGADFIAQSEYAALIVANPDAMTAFVTRLVEWDEAEVFVAEIDGQIVGMLGIFAFTHTVSGERTAMEAFWWVAPNARGTAGIRLLTAAEAWAHGAGATRLQMIAPNDRVASLYQRRGYRKVEVIYQREL